MTSPALQRSRSSRVWYSLGSARMVRIIFVCMVVYFLIIGGLVLGYSNVQKCLANYSDLQAASSQGRSEAAAIDRRLNTRYDELSTSERQRLRVDQDAFLELMEVLVKGDNVNSSAVQVAMEKVRTVNKESARIGDLNDKERTKLDTERARADALRQLNPVPDAPSKKC